MGRMLYVLLRGAHFVSMAMVFAIMVLISTDVILRYCFNEPITGSLEIVEFMQVVLVFLCFGFTLRIGAHVRADIVVQALPWRGQALVDFLTSLISLSVFTLMAWSLAQRARAPGAAFQVSDMLDIPVVPFRWIAFAGVALMCLELLYQVTTHLRVIALGRDAAR